MTMFAKVKGGKLAVTRVDDSGRVTNQTEISLTTLIPLGLVYLPVSDRVSVVEELPNETTKDGAR